MHLMLQNERSYITPLKAITRFRPENAIFFRAKTEREIAIDAVFRAAEMPRETTSFP